MKLNWDFWVLVSRGHRLLLSESWDCLVVEIGGRAAIAWAAP
jgi:hypothetical protein